jgi:hypothetical protein
MVKDLVLARFLKIVKMNQAVGRTQENMWKHGKMLH